jgi:hypothetical protein
MTSDMAFECLLVCRDPSVFGTISRILSDLSICTNLCLSSSKAFNLLLKGGSTDLIVIDWEGEASSELLSEIWKSSRRQKPTIVAISALEGSIPGAHVVLKKPVTMKSGTESLKAAYSRMLLDHRRHARYALMMSVMAADHTNRTVPITVTDIGDGGVGLSTKAELTIGDLLSFRLLLPGEKKDIHLELRVLWTREYGRAGCVFLRIPPLDVDRLHDWLKRKSQLKKPLISMG